MRDKVLFPLYLGLLLLAVLAEVSPIFSVPVVISVFVLGYLTL
jgi:hypothetical protein